MIQDLFILVTIERRHGVGRDRNLQIIVRQLIVVKSSTIFINAKKWLSVHCASTYEALCSSCGGNFHAKLAGPRWCPDVARLCESLVKKSFGFLKPNIS
jgi:hypothetical protein